MHIRDYPFENMGLEHNPGLDAGELMRSWQAEERRDFLSWVSRRAPPPLAQASQLAMATKGVNESFARAYAPADHALERLDALLPASDPIATLATLVDQLRTEEIDFLEGGTEVHEFGGATEPLAEAARRVQAMGRFVAEREDSQDDEFAHHALQRASVLVGQAAGGKGSPLPFPALVRLTAMARQDPHFAPLERATRMFSIGDRDIAYEQAGPRTPLWAIDIKLGSLFATCGTWRIPLPCPGAMTAQVLAAQLLDGERRLVLSGSNAAMAHRLTHCGETARQRAVTMNAAFGHLRSNARAPLVWMAAIGFAPLGLDQVTSGFGVSRRGTYTVSDALIAAGLVTRNSIKGMVVLTGQEPGMAKPFPSAPQSALAPSPAIAEFDAAMADIDRLLARSSSNYV